MNSNSRKNWWSDIKEFVAGSEVKSDDRQRLTFEELESRVLLSGSGGDDIDSQWITYRGEDTEVVTGSWLVAFNDNATFDLNDEDAVAAALTASQVKNQDVAFESSLTSEGVFEVVVDSGARHQHLKSTFSAMDGFKYVEPNMVYHLQETPNDPDFGELYGLHNTGQTGGTDDADIDAPEAWDISTGSRDVVLGVTDTGVDYNHPDLVDNMWMNPGEIAGDGIDNDDNGYVDDVYGWDFINDDSDPMDTHSHGTHVAGTIAATGNNGEGVVGVNWESSIMAIQIFTGSGSTNSTAIINAINYATMMRENGVNLRAVNHSWGGGGFSQTLMDSIEGNANEDILFIAAAGNNGRNTDSSPFYPASYDVENIVAVASSDHNDNRSGFSNFGTASTDLAAPGSNVYSTEPGGTYGFKSGTSMAAPQVTGAVGLVLSVYSDLSGSEVVELLYDSVDELDSLDGVVGTGGRLNVFNALTEPEPPTPDRIVGTPRADTFLFNATSGNYVILVNGTQHVIDPADVSYLQIDGLGGNDKISYISGRTGEEVTLAAGDVNILNDNGRLQFFNIENVSVQAQSTAGSAIFVDSAGDDVFNGRDSSGQMVGDGYSNQVDNFLNILSTSENGGNDRANLFGSSASDTFISNSAVGVLTSGNYSHRAEGFESVYAYAAPGGNDEAQLSDTSGDDVFIGRPEFSQIEGEGYLSSATGFDTVMGTATGGDDRALLYDSSKNDRFISRPTMSSMSGPGYMIEVENFERTDGFARGGSNDRAYIYDSAFSDKFYGRQSESYIVGRTPSGDEYRNSATQFERVFAYSQPGALDQAYLYDSKGDDRFIGRPDKSVMVGEGIYYAASDFDEVFAYSNIGGTDRAVMHDSAGDDVFRAWSSHSYMSGENHFYRAQNFDRVYAYSTRGDDVAHFHDSIGDDRFFGRPTRSFMRGNSYYNQASAFDEVYAYSQLGGDDRAYLFDSAGNDIYTAGAAAASLSGNGYFYQAANFERVFAYANAGGVDSAVMTDSAFNDLFYGRKNYGYMHGRGYRNYAVNFDSVTADAHVGGHDKLNVDDLKYRLIHKNFEEIL